MGVGLVHKHFNLAQDAITVQNGDVCKPDPVNDSLSKTSNSFFWNGTDFQAFEYGQEEPSTIPNDFLDALACHLETHQLSHRVALSELYTKKAMGADNYDSETMSYTRNSNDHKVSASDFISLMGLELTPHKSELGRKLFMERLDPATASQIIESHQDPT